MQGNFSFVRGFNRGSLSDLIGAELKFSGLI